MATTTTAVAMIMAVATIDRADKRAMPHTLCPEVQPPLRRVPKPTSKPAPTMRLQLAEANGNSLGAGAVTTVPLE